MLYNLSDYNSSLHLVSNLSGLTQLHMMVTVDVFVSSYLGGLHQVLDVEQSVVDPEDNPVKQSTVQGLRHGISHRTSLEGNTYSVSLVFLPKVISQFTTSN